MLLSIWQNVRRLLAVRLDNVGDMVMLSPALRTLRTHLPETQIVLMASPAGSQVAPLLPWVDEVMTLRAVWQDASGTMPLDPNRELKLAETVRDRNFDAAIIFTSFSQSPYPPATICYLAGIPIRLGQSKEFGGSVLSHWTRSLPDRVHQADRNLFLLESAGFTAIRRHLELRIPDDIQEKSDRLLQQLGIDLNQPFIVLAPGASCAARRYAPDRYAQVARILVDTTGLKLVVVGSDRERELCQPILESDTCGSILSLVGQTSIPELAAVIKRSSLVIANNSGPMHIADALLRPMVILFSGTEYESQWVPQSAPTKLLRRLTECSPCYQFNCPYHLECLDIPPTEVVSAALEMLYPYQRPQKESLDRTILPQAIH